MNQLKHIVHSLPRHATPSHPISAVSSGYQINAQSIFRHRSDFPRVNLSSNRPLPSQIFTGYGQRLLSGKPKVALTCSRNASTDRVGHPNIPADNKKREDSKTIAKAEAPDKTKKQSEQLIALPKTRNYAKLIADYSEAMEKENVKSKSKESPLPIGLLSRWPIESLISSLSSFDKGGKIFKGKLKKSDSISRVPKPKTKQSTLKTEHKKNSATMKSASQKRDYFTKNCDEEKYEKKINDANSQSSSNMLVKNTYIPNDFDVICDLTGKCNEQKNSDAEWSDFRDITDHKVKDLRNHIDDLKLLDSAPNNNQCQFNIVASEEKIELKLSFPVITRQPSTSKSIEAKDQTTASCTFAETKIIENIPKLKKFTYKYNRKANPLPWWTTPDSILNEKYEKAERTSSYSTPDIRVIYSEEMPNADTAKRKEKDLSSLRQEKLANLSKTKQYIKEELEKHKKNQRSKKIDSLTNIDGKKVEEDKRRSIDEKSDDKTANLSKMIDWKIESAAQCVVTESETNIAVETMNKNSIENTMNSIPEAKRTQLDEARKSSIIDQEYQMKRVMEPLKPLEKKKDGTLIDYGLKVPTRRPKKRQPEESAERNPEKKNSAAHEQEQQQVDSKLDCSIPRQITSSSQLLTPGKSEETGKNNRILKRQSLDLRRRNCSGQSITDRLVNSLQQQLRSEQMFKPGRRGDSCHSNCRLSTCAADSTIRANEERPEKQLIYSAWLNHFHTAGRLFIQTHNPTK